MKKHPQIIIIKESFLRSSLSHIVSTLTLIILLLFNYTVLQGRWYIDFAIIFLFFFKIYGYKAAGVKSFSSISDAIECLKELNRFTKEK